MNQHLAAIPAGYTPDVSDDFEREFLGGEGALHAEKVKLKRYAGLMLGLGGAFAAGSVAFGVAGASGEPSMIGAAVGVGLAAAFCSTLGLVFAVVRTYVTASRVMLSFGLAEQAIPLEAITKVDVIEMSFRERFRIRRDRARDFGARDFGSHVVRIDWTDEDKKARAVYVASEDADMLAHAIVKALPESVRKPKRAKVRLSAPVEGEPEAEEDELEEEAASGVAAARRSK